VEDDNTAMGAAVNIAARMEQHAPPGGLRISHDTWSQERGAASVERGLQGLATPMVGRDAELQRLLKPPAARRHRQSRPAVHPSGASGC
jgi:class 3 adenylate cyclase